jgi:hypothetical protein
LALAVLVVVELVGVQQAAIQFFLLSHQLAVVVVAVMHRERAVQAVQVAAALILAQVVVQLLIKVMQAVVDWV